MEEPQPSIKFYTDAHIAKAVAVQLRNQSVDIVRCEEVGLATAKDLQHLKYAVSEGRIMVSMDRDFLDLHDEWQTKGLTHAGIIIVAAKYQGEDGIGTIVRELFFWYDAVVAGAATFADDIENQLLHIW